jgi:predicted AlkP superfamily phosphohydrolase/phosphomutase
MAPPVRSRPAGSRLAVLGLDGVGAPLVQSLIDGGVMPRFAALRRHGTLAKMTSTLPTVSNVSWASFMTGVNPGRHGIFGFTDVKPDSYGIGFPNYTHVRAPTIWDALGAAGRRAIVLNVPGTYPAKDIHGVLVSGFVAVSLERAVRPASALAVLREHGYQIDVDYVNADQRPDAFFADLLATLEARRRVFHHYLADEWECFLGVVTETDRLHHYFWHVWEDRTHPLHQRFLDFYGAVDALIGEVADTLGDVTPLFVVADHGHAAIDAECYPNAWLRSEGLLRFTTDSPRSLADLDPSSRAFVLDPGRLYLNRKGRFARGSVESAEADAVLAHVGEGLLALEYESGGVSRPVIKAMHRREDLYDGPCVAAAPDAVLEGRVGFDVKGGIGRADLFGRSVLTGMHTYDDALFFVNRPDVPVADLAITDVAPTLLAWLGCPPVAPMDGRALVAGCASH